MPAVKELGGHCEWDGREERVEWLAPWLALLIDPAELRAVMFLWEVA